MSTQDGRFGIEILFLRVNPAQAEKRRAIIDWMSPLNFLQRQAEVFSMMQPGTGQWLLSDAHFKAWESDAGKILWCRGMRELSHLPKFPGLISRQLVQGKQCLRW